MKPFVPSLTTAPAPARKRGRPPGMGRRRIGKRFAIAQAVVSGKPIASIARELGVSRSWASREAHRPGTMAMIHALHLPEGQQVKALISAFCLDLAARERRRFEAQWEERGDE
jgi:transposase-like protein